MIAFMTIARDFTSQSGQDDAASNLVHGDVMPPLGEYDVPVLLRAERLTSQISLFERAGYVLETRTALQAVVAKPRGPRPVRTALLVAATAGLYLLPLLIGATRSVHRVVITVDGTGAVRFA
jgi:hypothetical protein